MSRRPDPRDGAALAPETRTGGRGPPRGRGSGQMQSGTLRERRDSLATEEPLEIRLSGRAGGRRGRRDDADPGHDFELATGFLHGEGLCPAARTRSPTAPTGRHAGSSSTWSRSRRAGRRLARRRALQGSCQRLRGLRLGVAGRAARPLCRLPDVDGPVSTRALYRLPDALRRRRACSSVTGGLHGAGLFTADGSLIAAREDVGRHNAVDKLVGWGLLGGRLPLRGRAHGQRAVRLRDRAEGRRRRIPVVCAVSAPSSLAVAVAEDFGMTLVGFLRGSASTSTRSTPAVGP